MGTQPVRAAVFTLLLSIFAAPALAAGIVVRPGEGTPIADALAQAQAGDRIILQRGLYHEDVTVALDDITIIGRGAVWEPASVTDTIPLTVDGNRVTVQGVWFRNGDTLVVARGDSATFRACRFTGAQDAGLRGEGESLTVDRSRFAGNGGFALEVSGTASGAQILRTSFLGSSSSAVFAQGDDLLLDRLTVRNIDDAGLDLRGCSRATISRCTIRSARDQGIVAEDCALVQIRLNRVQGAGMGGIVIEGNQALVERNTVGDTSGGAAIDVFGDGARILRNRCDGGAEEGVVVSGATATVEANQVRNFTDAGVWVGSDGMSVLRNVARDCGSYTGNTTFQLTGTGGEISGNRAIGSAGDGFRIQGSNLALTDDRAINCVGDGFDVASGTGNSLDRCLATGCDAEALDNSGTDTSVTGCTFRNSRILLANDGTFDQFSGNNVELSDAIPAEID